MELQEAIKIWKENNIQECEMKFSCGGDSMNDYSFSFSDGKGSEVACPELESFFDNEVFGHVEFYVNSDGHYQGEAGTVTITLEEDKDEGEYFEYSKSAVAEFSETWNSTMEVELPQEMADFINKNVSNINGSQEDFAINFKRDFILTEEDEKLLEELETLILDETGNYCPEDCSDIDDWYTFTTNDDGDDLKMNDNKLTIKMSNQYTSYQDSID